MRTAIIALLFLAAAAQACRAPAPARFHSRGALPFQRPAVRGIPTTISVPQSCNRPLIRRGHSIPAFIQSFDSASGALVFSSVQLGRPMVVAYPPAVYQKASCLPVESHDGQRQTLAALKPERFMLLWVSDIVMPTQPPQFTLNGIEVFDSLPVAR
jgi:hypothetical protein